ncbi:MAG TPA: mechanosensitive ion channel family protein [Pseudobdellovibrionaceae bacterium]|nr:mechanosensitive ion channel family protein [Pseudobdellovibrionaceae bacterium]
MPQIELNFPNYLQTLIRLALILTLGYGGQLLIRQITILFHRFILPKETDAELERRNETLKHVVRYILNTLLIFIVGLLFLSELGISLAPILGAAGVVGVAVGFGAQSLVKDYFSGFFILMENQVRKGDVIEVAGKSGLVEDLTLRYIRLRDYSGQVHFVPNGLITTVTNMTLEYSYALIEIGVAYRENLDEVLSTIAQTAQVMRQEPTWSLKTLEQLEIAGVENLGDSSILIKSRWKSVPLQQWEVRREFLKRIKKAFEDKNIEIPFPHITLYSSQIKNITQSKETT